MHQRALLAWCLLLGVGFGASQSHASIIQSMTIEEIGSASGGLGSSAVQIGGGRFSFSGPNQGTINSYPFVSAGSTDEAIIMGSIQGDLAFTPGFIFAGFLQVTPNTLLGAPSGTIEQGMLMLDLSGWGANVSDSLGFFPMAPNAGTLTTAIAMIDAMHYFYTADWSHTITQAESPPFAGLTGFWHLEGIATVPEPGTIWLAGAGLLGLLMIRRRKLG